MATTSLDVEGGTQDPVIDVGLGGLWCQLVQMVSAGSSPKKEQLALALWIVSSLTLALDLSTLLYKPAMGPVFGGHKPAYYGTLAGILAVVAVEMATAYRLPRGRAQLAAFAKALLRFAILLLLVVAAVSGYGLIAKL